MKIRRRFDNYIIIKLNIAYFRKLKGYTQEKLAKIIRISPNYLSNIESVHTYNLPSLYLLHDIADALDVPVLKLLQE